MGCTSKLMSAKLMQRTVRTTENDATDNTKYVFVMYTSSSALSHDRVACPCVYAVALTVKCERKYYRNMLKKKLHHEAVCIVE